MLQQEDFLSPVSRERFLEVLGGPKPQQPVPDKAFQTLDATATLGNGLSAQGGREMLSLKRLFTHIRM